MKTTHRVLYSSAIDLSALDNSCVSLVVTSPPYPMIEMWDELFCRADPNIGQKMNDGREQEAFESMHRQLDQVWTQLPRVVCDGGIVCINIGNATRTLNDNFQLFSSHSRIISKMVSLGFQNLPNIIWRKTTNAPNKFMGSGMLPPGAYVTLEHEYILVFRKGSKREFRDPEEKRLRRESAFFWEERNQWFSDVWFDLKGIGQELNNSNLRKRSAAYPFDLPYRLINMFSIKGDCVLDPFLGTGTTSVAAAATERNSIGYEVDTGFRNLIDRQMLNLVPLVNTHIAKRIEDHRRFAELRQADEKGFKFTIESLGIPCASRQETDIVLRMVESIVSSGQDTYHVSYRNHECQPLQSRIVPVVDSRPRQLRENTAQTTFDLS